MFQTIGFGISFFLYSVFMLQFFKYGLVQDGNGTGWNNFMLVLHLKIKYRIECHTPTSTWYWIHRVTTIAAHRRIWFQMHLVTRMLRLCESYLWVYSGEHQVIVPTNSRDVLPFFYSTLDRSRKIVGHKRNPAHFTERNCPFRRLSYKKVVFTIIRRMTTQRHTPMRGYYAPIDVCVCVVKFHIYFIPKENYFLFSLFTK